MKFAYAEPACPELACPEPACPELACPEPACPEPACPEPACPEPVEGSKGRRVEESKCIEATQHFPLPISHFTLPTSHFPLPTSHFPLPTSHFPLHLQIAFAMPIVLLSARCIKKLLKIFPQEFLFIV